MVLTFSHVVSREQIWVIRLGGRHPCPLRPLASPPELSLTVSYQLLECDSKTDFKLEKKIRNNTSQRHPARASWLTLLCWDVVFNSVTVAHTYL